MAHVMELYTLMFCVFTSSVSSITVSTYGNSPEMKIIGGGTQKRQGSVEPMIEDSVPLMKPSSRKSDFFPSKLPINERYRRLIPYMTFYYANDLTTFRPENTKTIEVEKAEMIEAQELDKYNQRQEKKISYFPQRTIPRYQGNRLTHFNLASANPTKIYYRNGIPFYQNPSGTPNFNPLLPGYVLIDNGRIASKPNVQPPLSVLPLRTTTSKPYIYLYKPEDLPNVKYYVSEKETPPKYKLVPYEQTPPVKVAVQDNIYETKKPYDISVAVLKEQFYIKPKPPQFQYFYDTFIPSSQRKEPVVTDNFYQPQSLPAPPLIENGFRPIVQPNFAYTTNVPGFTTTATPSQVTNSVQQKQNNYVDSSTADLINRNKENDYQYVVEQPKYTPEQYTKSNTFDLAALLTYLQQKGSIPKPITRENVGSSIRTLLQVLNALKAAPQESHHTNPVLNQPEPIATQKDVIDATPEPLVDKAVIATTPTANDDNNADIQNEPYLAPVNMPSQYLDDFQMGGGSIQRFPMPMMSDEDGGTPGRPGDDYPILSTIPETSFNCKTQRYKGFFADTETRCQVWHYCDLNGGQASFLCPNGTIFSQAGLTCDWWYNVKCSSTTQLYVLNESLYKFILPQSPKFPEDFSGPLVDKYLTLKFKEMEEQFRKNKKKQKTSGKDEKENSSEESNETVSDVTKNIEKVTPDYNTVSEASVTIDSAGTRGNVERLQD